MNTVLNLTLFQIGWFATVLGAGYGKPWLALVAAVLLVPIHGCLAGKQIRADMRLMAVALLMGLIWDSTLLATGLVTFKADPLLGALVPYWMLVLWVLFSLTINHSLRWLQGRYGLASLFGAIGGALSYWAGQRLGAINFPDTITALGVIAVGWAVMTPLLFNIAGRINGCQRPYQAQNLSEVE